MVRTQLLAIAVATALALPAAGQDDYIERMEQEHAGETPTATPATEAPPRTAVTSAAIAYATIDGVEITGYLARADGATAGVILIHEWWGLNDNIRTMAERLAGEGYVALAVDLYEGESAADRDGASRLARAAGERPERVEENLRQAIAFLRDREGVSRLGVMGWCFGGGWSLRTALRFPDSVDAAVIYYGRIPTDREALAPLEAPVLGLFGALDGGIPPDRVRAFEATLHELGKRASIHIYEGADHAFANPSGSRYQKEAAEDAWAKTVAFFADELGGR